MDGVPPDEFFSIQLRYAIATFLFAVFAYAVALAYQQFDATGILGSPETPGHTIYSLPFHLCAVVLALAGLWLLLLISAAACTTPGLRLHYSLFWVEHDFVSASWTGMSWASTVAFFVVFPFAYLYEEAEGITSQSGLMGRVIETTIVQVLVSILFHGSLGLIQFLLTGQRLGLSFFTSGYAFQLPGLLLFLVYFRDGFRRMVLGAVDLFESWNRRSDPEQIAVYEFALESVLLQIERLPQEPKPRYLVSSQDNITLGALQQQLYDLQNGHFNAVRKRTRWQTLSRNLIATVLLVLSIVLPCGIALRSVLKCEELVSDALWRLFGLQIKLNVIRVAISSISLHPLLSLSVDVSLVVYLLAAVASAAFDSSSFKWVAGLQGHTRSPIQYLLARNTFILLLCANLPVVTSLLGITQIDIEKVFPDPKRYPSLVYCTTFLIIQLISALELFGVPSRRPVVLLSKLLCYCCCCRWACRRRRRKPPDKQKHQ